MSRARRARITVLPPGDAKPVTGPGRLPGTPAEPTTLTVEPHQAHLVYEPAYVGSVATASVTGNLVDEQGLPTRVRGTVTFDRRSIRQAPDWLRDPFHEYSELLASIFPNVAHETPPPVVAGLPLFVTVNGQRIRNPQRQGPMLGKLAGLMAEMGERDPETALLDLMAAHDLPSDYLFMIEDDRMWDRLAAYDTHPDGVSEAVAEIAEVWARQPDMRLGQLSRVLDHLSWRRR